jgi:hypothetical protein
MFAVGLGNPIDLGPRGGMFILGGLVTTLERELYPGPYDTIFAGSRDPAGLSPNLETDTSAAVPETSAIPIFVVGLNSVSFLR